MALPASSQICFSQLRSEFGYSGQVCMSTFYNNRYTCKDPRSYCLSSWYGYYHSPCSTGVTINYYTPFNIGCYNYLTFGAASSTAVDTNVDVTIYWYGDLGGYMSGTITISAYTSCNTASFYSGGGVNCIGENQTATSAYISPSSSGSQSYSIGNQYNIGYCPC